MKTKQFLMDRDINVDASLDLLGDMEMYNELTADFYEELESRISDISNYIEAKDIANYAILAHSIKSDSKYLGYKRLVEIALEHELKGKESDFDYIQTNFSKLINELKSVGLILKEYLEK